MHKYDSNSSSKLIPIKDQDDPRDTRNREWGTPSRSTLFAASPDYTSAAPSTSGRTSLRPSTSGKLTYPSTPKYTEAPPLSPDNK